MFLPPYLTGIPPFGAIKGPSNQIGPGRKTLYTIWRPVLKGSKSDNPAYRKPNIIKWFR